MARPSIKGFAKSMTSITCKKKVEGGLKAWQLVLAMHGASVMATLAMMGYLQSGNFL
jgi:hypothetical protein